MISNFNETYPKVLDELMNSKFEFYITGSRFFGNYKNTSDWDLFTEYSSSVKEYLNSIGFKAETDTIYDDVNTYCIMFKNTTCNSRHTEVQIQLVYDVNLKNEIQKVINDKWDYISSYRKNKEQEKAFWAGAYMMSNYFKDKQNKQSNTVSEKQENIKEDKNVVEQDAKPQTGVIDLNTTTSVNSEQTGYLLIDTAIKDQVTKVSSDMLNSNVDTLKDTDIGKSNLNDIWTGYGAIDIDWIKNNN